mgnify:FL=1
MVTQAISPAALNLVRYLVSIFCLYVLLDFPAKELRKELKYCLDD